MAKKNTNGDGSHPRKRPDGRYEARYWVETKTGRKRRSVYDNTNKECVQKLLDAMAAKGDEPVFVAANIKVAEFFGQYEDVAKDAMKRRSFETCHDIARLHLLPSFGNLKLKALTREDVQRLTAASVRVAYLQRVYTVSMTCSLLPSTTRLGGG